MMRRPTATIVYDGGPWHGLSDVFAGGPPVRPITVKDGVYKRTGGLDSEGRHVFRMVRNAGPETPTTAEWAEGPCDEFTPCAAADHRDCAHCHACGHRRADHEQEATDATP
jgi:hypothetical protein